MKLTDFKRKKWNWRKGFEDDRMVEKIVNKNSPSYLKGYRYFEYDKKHNIHYFRSLKDARDNKRAETKELT